MKFVCELAIENIIATPISVCRAYEIYSGYFGKKLRVLQPLDNTIVNIIRRQNIKNIEFLPLWIQKDMDLSLLQALPDLQGLTIHSEVPIDWSPLQKLTRLTSLKLRTGGFRPQA